MEKIEGTVTTAISFAKIMDYRAREQIRRMCSNELTKGSKVRIMPDVHEGKGCTIGTTMTIIDKAVPNVVGVDIGCGMFTVDLGYQPIDFARLDKAAHEIPSGMNVWDEPRVSFDLQELYCYVRLKGKSWISRSLGSLGGGNHFIEIDETADGRHYLVIHSGSRNLGKKVAEYYQQIAISMNGNEKTLHERTDEMIQAYKEAGRDREINQAIKDLRAEENKHHIPDDLCYVKGKYLEQYLHDVALCQKFARLNRETMAKELLARSGLVPGDAFHTIHNYIDVGEMILRKGAIAAHAGEKVLIPINMRDGSILAIGKGNPDWNYSAPHGAGRLMSRTEAKKHLTMEEYKKEMAGIYTTSVSEGTLDEAPMAYKSLDDILDVIGDTVDVIEVMKPVYNFKATADGPIVKKKK